MQLGLPELCCDYTTTELFVPRVTAWLLQRMFPYTSHSTQISSWKNCKVSSASQGPFLVNDPHRIIFLHLIFTCGLVWVWNSHLQKTTTCKSAQPQGPFELEGQERQIPHGRVNN